MSGRLIIGVALTLTTFVAGASATTFTDVTLAAGIDYVQSIPEPERPGNWPSTMSGGAAVADYDQDGWADLLVTRLQAPDILYRNRGDGTFEDVTSTSGLSDWNLRSNGAAFGDIDNDGDLDLYITTMDDRRYYLFVNDGSGHFEEQALVRGAAIESSEDHHGFSVAFGDYDRDGWLDLHTTEWRRDALVSSGAPSHARLLRNRGAEAPGHFEDVTASSGVSLDDIPTDDLFGEGTYAFASAFVDLDDDGWPDLAVASDFGTSRLFWNDGDGTFTDGTVAAGVGTDRNGMGSTFGDYDQDGDLDWFVTAILNPASPVGSGNRLYRNEGGRLFFDATDLEGVRDGGWGWGTVFFDADNDADLDLVMTTTGGDGPRLWENREGSFVESAAVSGLDDLGDGKGLLCLDYDRDGDLDIFIVNTMGRPVLYRNDSPAVNNWFRLRLEGPYLNRAGLGARVTLVAGGQTRVAVVGVNSHFLGQSESTLHFGLGTALVIDELRIEWPRGQIQTFSDVAVNQEKTAVTGSAPCFDGFDNDGDGLVDAADPGCAVGGGATEWSPSPVICDQDLPRLSDPPSLVAGGAGEAAMRRAVLIGVLLVPSVASGVMRFTDVTLQAGIDHVQALAPNYSPYMAGGAAVGDVDGDGDVDLFVTRDHDHDILYRNEGDGTFCDASVESGLDRHVYPSNGAAFADIDNDGDLDLYVTTLGEERFYLFVNDGAARFVEEGMARGVAQATGEFHAGFSVAVGDFDRDGFVDLHTTEWRRDIDVSVGAASHSRLLRNRGHAAPGFFVDVTEAAGVLIDEVPTATPQEPGVFSFASAFVDLDGDGWQDLAIASDFGTSRLFWNRGDGTFEDGTVTANVGSDRNGMGSTFGDYDGDGDLDWFISCIFIEDVSTENAGNRLFRNEGGRFFVDRTTERAVRRGHWGWGAAFGDFDADGDLDLVQASAEGTPSRLWRNDGDGPMFEEAESVGLVDRNRGKGLLLFDFDADGDQDIFIVNTMGRPNLYRNDSDPADWLRVELTSPTYNTEALGAKVELVEESGRRQVRQVGVSSHFLGQSERAVQFGLGAPGPPLDEVQVTWPSGQVQVLVDVDRNQLLRLDEPWRPECDDGWDNDGDGRVDFPAEEGCAGPGDDQEWDANLVTCEGGDCRPRLRAVPSKARPR